jgi:catechol 2,3-dioxygenase-like lactoylglutathione lyase family enzyme
MNVRGVNHIGVTVRDLDETVAWVREMFDLEPVFFVTGAGAEVDASVQLEDASISCAFFMFGNLGVEFLEYSNPRGRDFDLRNCDVGAIHVCFGVDDLQATYERLEAKGVEFNSETPFTIDDGPLAGTTYAYFRDPHGIQFELFQVPESSPTIPR